MGYVQCGDMVQELPVWYNELAPLGSAVRYIASLSPAFRWVAIFAWKGSTLELGPCIGSPAKESSSVWAEPVLDSSGKLLGQIEIEIALGSTIDDEVKNTITRIAKELGELWPA